MSQYQDYLRAFYLKNGMRVDGSSKEFPSLDEVAELKRKLGVD